MRYLRQSQHSSVVAVELARDGLHLKRARTSPEINFWFHFLKNVPCPERTYHFGGAHRKDVEPFAKFLQFFYRPLNVITEVR
jgi:hypothetical protein